MSISFIVFVQQLWDNMLFQIKNMWKNKEKKEE